MELVFAMILSIVIKAVSAIVELLIHVLITNGFGVSEYGNYTFYASIIVGAYFMLFGGSIKLNTFYLSTPESSLSNFKKKYILYYVTPIILTTVLYFIIVQNPYGLLSGVILFIYYLAFDSSSVFFSRGYQLPALIGEYLFGRIFLLIGILLAVRLYAITRLTLLSLYGFQFLAMLFWFVALKKKLNSGTKEIKVPIRKLLEYQLSDVAHSLISYSPTILQYILGGAFTAGFMGIISIVKRFINFISGPTAKVFLPEFSRLYKNGKFKELEQSYLMVVRIQMIFISTIGIVLIGFPHLFLQMFSPELVQYSGVFIGTAICFLFVAGIGPIIGLLQMTGNEKVCNRNQWISIGIMIIIWFLFYKEPLFAVYGLCIQVLTEGGMNYIYLCRWFGKNIVPIKGYTVIWLPVLVLSLLVRWYGLQYSYIALVLCIFFVFVWVLFLAMLDPMIKTVVTKKLKSFKEK